MSLNAQGQNNYVKALKLNVVDARIKNILSKIYLGAEEDDGKSEKVFVVRSEKKEEYCELRFSVLHKNDFSWFLLDKNDKLIGYFPFKKKNVLVFGDNNNLFKASSYFKSFDFIKLSSDQKPIDNGEPPVIFEPLVWIYNIKEEKINFVGKGRYYLLE